MRRLRCKGEEDKWCDKNGSRIDLRSDIVIKGVEGVEEAVVPIEPYST